MGVNWDESDEERERADMGMGKGNENGLGLGPSDGKKTEEGSSCGSEDLESSSGDLVSKEQHDDANAPKDAFLFVYLVVLLNGIGSLLSWNLFITIAPQYYVDYWFSDKLSNGTYINTHYANSFMSALGITSQVPNFVVSLLNILNIIRGPLMYRIMAPLVFNCILVCIILAFAIFQDPNPQDRQWFYIVNLIIILLMNGSNGLYQNSIFGLFADFPAAYTNALIVGSNICGTFTSLLSIMATLVFSNSPKTVAIIYFSIGFGVIVACFVSLLLVRANPYYNYYVEKGNRARAMMATTHNMTTSAIEDVLIYFHQLWDLLKGLREAFKYCYLQLISVWLVFFVTLSVFPTILVGFEPEKKDGTWNSVIKNQDIYRGVTTFLNFNFFAAIGSTTASYIQFPGPKLLIIPCLLRLVFIPVFAFSNYQPTQNFADRHLPVLYREEWIFFFANTLMAFTSGYFSSLGMMYAPRVVPPRLSKLAGQASALALVGGIMCGVGFTPAITAFVKHVG